MSSLAVKCIVVLPPPLLLDCPLAKALVYRNIGWPDLWKFCIIFSAVRSQDPFGLQLYVAYHFFSEPSPRKDQWPRGNLRAYSSTLFWIISTKLFISFCSHTMSLSIDMKMILLLSPAGTHCNSPILLWISLRMPAVVNLGKIFHSNSMGFPSIRFSSLK